jgi:hypothetical protein
VRREEGEHVVEKFVREGVYATAGHAGLLCVALFQINYVACSVNSTTGSTSYLGGRSPVALPGSGRVRTANINQFGIQRFVTELGLVWLQWAKRPGNETPTLVKKCSN